VAKAGSEVSSWSGVTGSWIWAEVEVAEATDPWMRYTLRREELEVAVTVEFVVRENEVRKESAQVTGAGTEEAYDDGTEETETGGAVVTELKSNKEETAEEVNDATMLGVGRTMGMDGKEGNADSPWRRDVETTTAAA